MLRELADKLGSGAAGQTMTYVLFSRRAGYVGFTALASCFDRLAEHMRSTRAAAPPRVAGGRYRRFRVGALQKMCWLPLLFGAFRPDAA